MAIIDLEKTLICLRRACNLIDLIIRSKGHFLFVNTNPEYNKIVQQTAISANQSFLNHKWIGGFLTNWNHMQNVQKHFQDFSTDSLYNSNLNQLNNSGGFTNLRDLGYNNNKVDSAKQMTVETSLSNSFTKVMNVLLKQPRFKKMQKSFEGCFSKENRDRALRPDCIIILNAKKNSTAILEASLLQIPIISVVDSNTPSKLHKLISYPIPANTDSIEFIHLICNCFLKTILSSQTSQKKEAPKAVCERNLSRRARVASHN
uniref:Ribosomal protein S2 n=1 Tax=Gonatozygon brebissonii TaxID=184482 RepID=A0A6G9IGH0_9VIRI|nr:ribosomal protein S2 [Gonatozygon brebissonii]QIQ23058.1 ribosomal protein S2 [Gonatozygon brebissonii]